MKKALRAAGKEWRGFEEGRFDSAVVSAKLVKRLFKGMTGVSCGLGVWREQERFAGVAFKVGRAAFPGAGPFGGVSFPAQCPSRLVLDSPCAALINKRLRISSDIKEVMFG